MALFDPDNIRSSLVCSLWKIIDLFCECQGPQRLVEATGTDEEKKAAVRQRITIGPQPPPTNADRFTVDELAARFIEFQFYFPDEGGRTVKRSNASFDRADVLSDIHLITRRFLRPIELSTPNEAAGISGESDLYLGFTDCIVQLEEEIIPLGERRGVEIQSFLPTQGPYFHTREGAIAQGEYLVVHHAISVGDSIGE